MLRRAPHLEPAIRGYRQREVVDADVRELPRSLDAHDVVMPVPVLKGCIVPFCFIEQGGSSLYPSLARRVTSPEVLDILLSIGPTETAHFQTWHDKAGNAVSKPLAPLRDPTNGLVFPDLNAPMSEALQTNLIMPEPTVFLSRRFPAVSIIRPTATEGAARGAVKALTDDGLFIGQSPQFFAVLRQLAEEADAARRGY